MLWLSSPSNRKTCDLSDRTSFSQFYHLFNFLVRRRATRRYEFSAWPFADVSSKPLNFRQGSKVRAVVLGAKTVWFPSDAISPSSEFEDFVLAYKV